MKKENRTPTTWRKSKTLLLLFLCLCYGNIMAQQEPTEEMKRALEREVKTSGLYHYAEAVDKEKTQAATMALSQLLATIQGEGTIDATALTQEHLSLHVGKIELPRGNRIRVITFLKKAELPTLLTSLATAAPTKKEPIKLEEKPLSVEEQKETITEKATTPPAEQANPVTGSLTTEQQALLAELVGAGSVTEINKLLRENKMKGKLVFGSMNTLTNSEVAYILVYKANGEIIALLDRGSGSDRQDLISGERMPVPGIYKGNLRLWFQLL